MDNTSVGVSVPRYYIHKDYNNDYEEFWPPIIGDLYVNNKMCAAICPVFDARALYIRINDTEFHKFEMADVEPTIGIYTGCVHCRYDHVDTVLTDDLIEYIPDRLEEWKRNKPNKLVTVR